MEKGTILALMILAAVGCSDPAQVAKQAQEDAKWQQELKQVNALTMADDFVKDRLVSPGSMKEPNVHDEGVSVTDLGEGKWHVVSFVDSQNALGGLMRTHFDETLTNTEGDKWHLDDLKLEGDQ